MSRIFISVVVAIMVGMISLNQTGAGEGQPPAADSNSGSSSDVRSEGDGSTGTYVEVIWEEGVSAEEGEASSSTDEDRAATGQ